MSDVDYDFFDTPRTRDNQNNNESKKQSSAANVQLHISKGTTSSESTVTGNKPPAHPKSVTRKQASHTSDDDSDHSSSASSSRHVSSNNTKTGGGGRVEVVKRTINAKIPTMIKDHGSHSDDDSRDHSTSSDSETEKSSRGVKSPIDGRASRRDRAAGEELQKSNNRDVPNKKQARRKNTSHTASSESDTTSSDSEVTNVSPLNTPHHANKNRMSTKKTDKRVTVSDRQGTDINALLQDILDMDAERGQGNYGRSSRMSPAQKGRSSSMSGVMSRKNYSFSNDTVRQIERENQRLMRRIMLHAADAEKTKHDARYRCSSNKMTATLLVEPPRRPTSAQINRNRELQRIEAENLALLRRLQLARPSKVLLDATGTTPTNNYGGSSSGISWRSPSGMSGRRTRPPSSIASRPQSAKKKTTTKRPDSGIKGQADDWEEGW